MIVTVTVNPAVDRTLVVRGFAVGAINRASVDRVEAGGKGINVARYLRELGCEVVATGFLGADDRHGIAATLMAEGIDTDFVAVPGETRLNLKVLDPVTAVETEINEPGYALPPGAIAALARKVQQLARHSAVIVFSGSLPPEAPPDLYAQLIALARAGNARTVLDAAGDALTGGIAAGPDLVKPNRAEVEELLQTSIGDGEGIAAAAQRLLDLGARVAVISLGANGALSASRAGVWRARAPTLPPRNTVGAGDAMVAALAYALTRSLPITDALRLATAAGCAAATAQSAPFHERIQQLLPQVSLEVLSTIAAPSDPPTTTAVEW